MIVFTADTLVLPYFSAFISHFACCKQTFFAVEIPSTCTVFVLLVVDIFSPVFL